MKPVVKKPVVKKPAAKQLPKTKGSSKEGLETLKLPPKRSAVLLPGPHEDVSSDSSDTVIPNPDMSVAPTRLLLELSFAASILGSGLRGVGTRHWPRGR
ncbi:hypothetical protein PF002_g31836 [Phytophthora fragariae]|uniref:Uncharacterized protein n=1 Tax=Phytophthora fragariae TaxID=53985 RepID=A0A6A3VDY2_9STRA|nr:hypothetical protein PF002_g31836 [Phytophthora fragariae]